MQKYTKKLLFLIEDYVLNELYITKE